MVETVEIMDGGVAESGSNDIGSNDIVADRGAQSKLSKQLSPKLANCNALKPKLASSPLLKQQL